MIRAFVGAIAFFVVFAIPGAAQSPPAGIQATGTGTATTPARTAHLQILLGSSASFGMGPMGFEPGTPGPGSDGFSSDHLTPVVDAIVGTGVEPDAVTIGVSTTDSMFGPGGPETAQVRAAIAQPTREVLVDLVATIDGVARENGLTVLYVGARYEAAGCVTLTQQAREAAIADAETRAEGLAQGLGMTLGELTQASEFSYVGPTGTDSCATAATEAIGPQWPRHRSGLRSRRHRGDGHRASHADVCH
jgi:hypothetical protein